MCGAEMAHLKDIHTFRCACGYEEWYPERWKDEMKKMANIVCDDVKLTSDEIANIVYTVNEREKSLGQYARKEILLTDYVIEAYMRGFEVGKIQNKRGDHA